MQGFVNRLVQELPLRQFAPVDGGAVRKLLAGRSGGIIAHFCEPIERAAIAAIRGGREMIDLAARQEDRLWRGIVGPGPVTAPARDPVVAVALIGFRGGGVGSGSRG